MATFVMTLVGGVVGLVAGFCAGALAGMGIAAVTRMANFEGTAGYFAVFLCGPIGAVLGLVAGVWLTLSPWHARQLQCRGTPQCT